VIQGVEKADDLGIKNVIAQKASQLGIAVALDKRVQQLTG